MVWKEQKFDDAPPEDFDPARPYADPVAMIEQREYIVREKLIAIEMAKVLRERVQQCYRREGVNHYQKCREHVKNYLRSISNVGWGKDSKPNYETCYFNVHNQLPNMKEKRGQQVLKAQKR